MSKIPKMEKNIMNKETLLVKVELVRVGNINKCSADDIGSFIHEYFFC